MENLKLEHLSPYLPFSLDMIINTPFGNEKRKLELDCGHDFGLHLMQCNVKPILRPLSDLTKEIEVNGKKFVPSDELNGNIDNGLLNWIFSEVANEKQVERLFDLAYCNFPYLLEWHFDIFGLIDKGLAIDINTLSNE